MFRSRMSIRSTAFRDGGRIVRPPNLTDKIPRPGTRMGDQWQVVLSAKWHNGKKKLTGSRIFFWRSKNPYLSCCYTNTAKVSRMVTRRRPAMWTYRWPQLFVSGPEKPLTSVFRPATLTAVKRYEVAVLPGRQTPTAGSIQLAVPLCLQLSLWVQLAPGCSGVKLACTWCTLHLSNGAQVVQKYRK